MGIRLFDAQRNFELNPKGFRARQLHPVLVWVGAAAERKPGDDEDGEGQSVPTHAGLNPARPASGDVLVLSVVKQDARANAFAMGITVGRVATNDVVLDDPSVSRFHAYFQHDARKDGWTITDADSQNGTLVLGQKIVGHQPLADGAKVTFGDVVTWFLEPDRFCAWLAAGADPSTL